MRKLATSLFLFFLMATAVAEIKGINITIFGMD